LTTIHIKGKINFFIFYSVMSIIIKYNTKIVILSYTSLLNTILSSSIFLTCLFYLFYPRTKKTNSYYRCPNSSLKSPFTRPEIISQMARLGNLAHWIWPRGFKIQCFTDPKIKKPHWWIASLQQLTRKKMDIALFSPSSLFADDDDFSSGTHSSY